MTKGEFERRIKNLLDGYDSEDLFTCESRLEFTIEIINEAQKEFPKIDFIINLDEYSGLNAFEAIYVVYHKKCEEWFDKWFGDGKNETPES